MLQYGEGRDSRVGGRRPQKSGLGPPGLPLPDLSLDRLRNGQPPHLAKVLIIDAGDTGAPPFTGKSGGKGAPLHIPGNDHNRLRPEQEAPVPFHQVLTGKPLQGRPCPIGVSPVGMCAVSGAQEQPLGLMAWIVQQPGGP